MFGLAWFMIMFSYYGIFLWLPSVLVGKGFSMVNSFGYVVIMTPNCQVILRQLGLLRNGDESQSLHYF